MIETRKQKVSLTSEQIKDLEIGSLSSPDKASEKSQKLVNNLKRTNTKNFCELSEKKKFLKQTAYRAKKEEAETESQEQKSE